MLSFGSISDETNQKHKSPFPCFLMEMSILSFVKINRYRLNTGKFRGSSGDFKAKNVFSAENNNLSKSNIQYSE